MQSNREWKLLWSWRSLVVQLTIAAVIGKMISYISHDFYPLNWIASALWFLSGAWVAAAFSTYSQESLSYFNGQTGKFQPRFQKRSRLEIFAVLFSVAIGLVFLGLLVQIYS